MIFQFGLIYGDRNELFSSCTLWNELSRKFLHAVAHGENGNRACFELNGTRICAAARTGEKWHNKSMIKYNSLILSLNTNCRNSQGQDSEHADFCLTG